QVNAESGFRSVQEQAAIIHGLLATLPLEQILTRVAVPGYSEHHSGWAVDLANNAALIYPLGQEFDKTDTFAWLLRNATRFGFLMSYPKDNPHGIMYEPWHWCFNPRT
ncbi:MAG: D-alanyl-D-alanine carboxypeptidase family protein, partial [Proteobacteria bacterium]|nr:D-alanyl-D-alanine carboxypeptidase family protein [Pseudomonadota bacterium]